MLELPKPGSGLPISGGTVPDAPPMAPPDAPDAPDAPPMAPSGGPGGPSLSASKSKAQSKIDEILGKGLDRAAAIKELEEEIDQAIRALIVGSEDGKSAQDVPSILKGSEDLYESQASSAYALLAPDIVQFKKTTAAEEKTLKETIENTINKDIEELKKELEKIKTDIQSSSTCQEFIKVRETELKELREQYTSVKANVLAPGKKTDPELVAAANIVVKKYEDRDAELQSLRALKAGDPLPVSLFVLVSYQSSRLARLEKRVGLVGSLKEITVDSEGILQSHKDMKWKLQTELKIYYAAWAKEKIALLQESGMSAGKAVTALSTQQTEYQEHLKEIYPDRIVELEGKAEKEGIAGKLSSINKAIVGVCKEISAQQEFNNAAELSDEDARAVLAPLVHDIGTFLGDTAAAADKAIETKVSIEEGGIRISAAIEQAKAIKAVVIKLKMDAKEAKEVAEVGPGSAEPGPTEVKQEKESITQTSKESEPMIFDFGPKTHYNAKELAILAKHFGLSLNYKQILAGLAGQFGSFKNPAEPDGKKLQTLETSFPRKQCRLRLVDAVKNAADIAVPDDEIILAKKKDKFVVCYRKKGNADSFEVDCNPVLQKLVESLNFNDGIVDKDVQNTALHNEVQDAVKAAGGYTNFQASNGMLNSKGVFQPRECIQSVLKIADINVEFAAREAKRKQEAAAAAAALKKQGGVESKSDDAGEDGVVFHTSAASGNVQSDTDSDTEATKAIGTMMASAAELEAMSAKLAEATSRYQQERQARQEAEQAREKEAKARQEAEKAREAADTRHAEIVAKVVANPTAEGALTAVLSPQQAAAVQTQKSNFRRR